MTTSTAPITGVHVVGVPVADQARALSEAGTKVGELLDFGAGVPPMFSLRDPDGNELRVVQLP